MENHDKKNRKEKEERTQPIPNHWEPVPGQALVAEEIARRIEAEERERKQREKEDEG